MDLASSYSSIIAGSYQYWQNRESVTLTSVGKTSNVTHSLGNCKRFDTDISDLPPQHQGIFTKAGLTWLLPVAILGGVTPKPMDTITDAGGIVYTIQSSNQNGWKNWFKCVSLDLNFAFGFANTLTFQRPVYTNVGGAKKITSYTTVQSGVSGLVIETGRDLKNFNAKAMSYESYDLHIQSLIVWRPDDQVVDENGVVYQINSSGIPGTIDNYLIYQMERVK